MKTLERIINLMEQNNFGNKELAEALNLDRQVVTDWKAGRSKSYKKYLYQIANFFNVSVDYLLGKTDIVNADNEKGSPDTEELENIISYHRDGKTVIKKLSKKQLDAIHALIETMKESDEDL